MKQESLEARRRAWLKAKFAPPPEPAPRPAVPTFAEMIPARDGVRLYSEIFLPARRGSFPVILYRSPYPKMCPSRDDSWDLRRYIEAGYAFVFQQCRGQGRSEGTFHLFTDDVEDGYDCIEWISAQAWCNGNIGMEGYSYAGHTQLLAARTCPPALKCIMPTAFVGSFIRHYPYAGGIFARGMMMQWYRYADVESWEDLDAPYGDMSVLSHPEWGPALRKRPLIDAANGILSGAKLASWREVLAHPLDDDYWKPVQFSSAELAALRLPMFSTAGWLDPSMGAVEFFERMEQITPGREHRYLLVGPWNHDQTYLSNLHDTGNAGIDLVAQRLAFFDHYLKNDDSAFIQADRVRVYITGADSWLDLPTLPAPGTQAYRMYLRSGGDARSFPGDGSLSFEPPQNEPPDQYVYDPAVPTPSASAAGSFSSLHDRRDIEVRADVLTYTSERLPAPLTILGELRLILHAASDATDTDWFVAVTEVFEDGSSVAFHGGNIWAGLRARYRYGFDKAVLLVPGEPALFSISLGYAGHRLAAGSRLRVSICSAAFPAFDPNTNTGSPAATEAVARPARQTVFHDVARPSQLVIPVLN